MRKYLLLFFGLLALIRGQSTSNGRYIAQNLTVAGGSVELAFTVSWWADDYPQNSAPGRLVLLDGVGNLVGRVVASDYRGTGLSVQVSGGGNVSLILTGQLGDVMKESARAALTYAATHASRLQIPENRLGSLEVHVHVPAGAIPKDGPSAGVAMFISLTSLLRGKAVRPDVAMTGEISLRGLVLPVGGIKEKMIAAARAGIRKVILPARNKRDLEDIPQSAKALLEFVWVEHVSEALEVALGSQGGEKGAADKAAPIKADRDASKAEKERPEGSKTPSG